MVPINTRRLDISSRASISYGHRLLNSLRHAAGG
jgi:hypothetical protein